MIEITPKLLNRFYSHVKITPNCWIWKAYKNKDGYGQFEYNNTKIKPHRFTYELLEGRIPVGLELDHLCRNAACVNPAHLDVVTHKENVRRGLSGWVDAIKTHCPRGHEYNEENTRMYNNERYCRTCNRERLALKGEIYE